MSTEQLIFLCLSFRGSGRLFSRGRVIDELPDEAIDLSVDRIQGRFRVAAAVLAHRAGGDLDGEEGVHNAYLTSARIRSIEIIVFQYHSGPGPRSERAADEALLRRCH